jgi:PncC family amidohydrolase
MSAIDKRANEVLQQAIACGFSLVTAESCTGGLLAQAFAKSEGASQNFHGGVVTYTKPMKRVALGVSEKLLKEQTAVCAPVAAAMAEGALAHSPADIAVSITGVAGPEPDEDDNPVGLVFCGLAQKGRETKVRKLESPGKTPEAVLTDAMSLALDLVEQACRKGQAK